MDKEYSEFWECIDFLYQNDALDHIILIGSWAEYIYEKSAILKDFTKPLRTLDIDLLIRNKNIPNKQLNLIQAAKSAGYLIDEDRLTGATKLYSVKASLEIEFLIHQMGSGNEPTLSTNLGVNAQALRHLSILEKNHLTLNIMNYPIKVPLPESYFLHKIIINKDRNKGILKKAEKDMQALLNLKDYIDKEKCRLIYDSLTKKEQKTVSAFLEKIDFEL